MKKFFAIAIIATSLAACNSSGSGSSSKDSTVTPIDSSKVDTSAPKMNMDTAAKKDTSKMSADTSKKK
ncbi:MAG TPA: hypothetical protein VGI82_12895 [Chitinophagaceae bacterium]